MLNKALRVVASIAATPAHPHAWQSPVNWPRFCWSQLGDENNVCICEVPHCGLFRPKKFEWPYYYDQLSSSVYAMPASWEVVCRWVPHPVLSITSGFSNIITWQRRLTTTTVGRRSCHTSWSYPWKLHACRANDNYFLYILFIFCSLYLLLFLIALFRTIVTVYTDNFFLYNYLWQMHKIIHLSMMGCFTPARGKTVQKNREVSGVKWARQFWSPSHCTSTDWRHWNN